MSGNKISDEDDEMLALGRSFQCGRGQCGSCTQADCTCGCHQAKRDQAALEAKAKWAEDVARPALVNVTRHGDVTSDHIARKALAAYTLAEKESRP